MSSAAGRGLIHGRPTLKTLRAIEKGGRVSTVGRHAAVSSLWERGCVQDVCLGGCKAGQAPHGTRRIIIEGRTSSDPRATSGSPAFAGKPVVLQVHYFREYQ